MALHLLRELDWLTPTSLEELEQQVLHVNDGVSLAVSGNLVVQLRAVRIGRHQVVISWTSRGRAVW